MEPASPRRVLGLDIGGANLKAALPPDVARSIVFPLWSRRAELPNRLVQLLQRIGPFEGVALTFTGELADCFATKAEGVRAIVEATCFAAAQVLTPHAGEAGSTAPASAANVASAAGASLVEVWSVDQGFVTPADAIARPTAVASANWHALASWIARDMAADEAVLLVDCGSTTTDVIPIMHGSVEARGATDLGRLVAGELVYTGARRTPLCAVTDRVRFRGQPVTLAAELFATMHDVAVVLGEVPEDEDDIDTADGRPATLPLARARLARMLCADASEVNHTDLRRLATELRRRQLLQIVRGIEQVLQRFRTPRLTFLLSGSGEFVAQQAVRHWRRRHRAARVQVRSLTDELGPGFATAACAYAVAKLATA